MMMTHTMPDTRSGVRESSNSDSLLTLHVYPLGVSRKRDGRDPESPQDIETLALTPSCRSLGVGVGKDRTFVGRLK